MTARRATVMGLGLFDGGRGATRYLAEQGYDVTVTDLKGADELAPSVQALADLDLTYRLGGHRDEDFRDADLVVVNPAVPPGNRYVRIAREHAGAVTTEIGLFTAACRGRVLAVTGTAGKSTTTALLAACLERAGRRVHLGGNIGRSLLGEVERIGPDDSVVLELSSFHLHWLRPTGWTPHIGVLTNVTPNHLDWHGTFAAYREDKTGILPAADGVFIACADDPEAVAIAAEAPGRVIWTARDAEPVGDAVLWRGGELISREGGAERTILSASDVRLLGAHALWNVASAAAAAIADDVAPTSIRAAVCDYDGLPHRLCPIGTFDGVLCVDDSKSTTPAAAALALEAFDRPVHLLAGGYDKKLDPAPLVEAAHRSARAVYCFGQTGPAIAAALRSAGAREVTLWATLDEAVAAARASARAGDVLLLSPGHASWDQFENYEARARAFAQAVSQ